MHTSQLSSMQCACIIFHPWPVPLYSIFHTLSRKLNEFWENLREYKIFILIYSTISSVTFLTQRLKEEFTELLSQICTGLHAKYPLLLSEFNET